MAEVAKKNKGKVVASAAPVKNPRSSQPQQDYNENEQQQQQETPQGYEHGFYTTNTGYQYGYVQNQDGVLVPASADYIRHLYAPVAAKPKVSEFTRLVNEVYKKRPARRQVAKGSQPVRPEFTHHSSDYNIWYHKKLGDRFTKEERLKAATKCCIATDAGYTKADKDKKDTWVCMYFARGHCTNGAECNYYHRPPTEEDEARLDMTHDIFGRERHRTYREDMGGVGSFAKNNKTLYITGMKREGNLEEIIRRHFSEWGELEYVRIIWDKAIAFVKYKLRAAAEFAKECMQDQSLDKDEVLSIRWSTEDPNPLAQEKENQEIVEQIAQKVAAKQQTLDPIYQYGGQIDYFPNQENPNAYPSTDQQYNYSTNAIADWLTNAGLQQYSDAFVTAGYYDLSQVAQLDETTLDRLKIFNVKHRDTLLTEGKRLYDYYASYYQQYYNTSATSDNGNNNEGGEDSTRSKRSAEESDNGSTNKKSKVDNNSENEDDEE